MERNCSLQKILAIKQRNTLKRTQISIHKLVQLRQEKIKNHTQDVDLSLLKHLKTFAGKEVNTSNIDADFCYRFAQYLTIKANIKASSAKTYLQKLNAILHEAVSMNYMTYNPMPQISKLVPKTLSKEKDYLTVEEVKRLEKAECPHLITKLAFLFSCFTGLRLSDIETLKWSNIHKSNNLYMLIKTQVKTGTEIRIPLNKQAIEILNVLQLKKIANSENVFTMYSRTTTAADLKAWVQRAKINKHITFHVSRVSFVTISISAGINIYVVSKLCGHSNVKTTQIYARMTDRTYIDAIILLDNIFKTKQRNTKNIQNFNLLL